MDDATLSQFVACYDMSFDLSVSDFFADLTLPLTSGELNVQVQTTTYRFATSISEENLNSLVQATKSKNITQSTTWAVKIFNDWRDFRNAEISNPSEWIDTAVGTYERRVVEHSFIPLHCRNEKTKWSRVPCKIHVCDSDWHSTSS